MTEFKQWDGVERRTETREPGVITKEQCAKALSRFKNGRTDKNGSPIPPENIATANFSGGNVGREAIILAAFEQIATASQTALTSTMAGRVIEVVQQKLLTLAEADAYLKKNGVDLQLEREREDHVRRMLRSGALAKQDADTYGAKFDAGVVSEADLRKLVEQRKEAPSIGTDVVFGVDDLTNQQAWDKLLVGGGGEKSIRNGRSYPFSEYEKVDSDGNRLANQEPTGEAGMVFVPHVLNLPSNLRRISADQQLATMATGKKYLGPQGYLRWFLDCVDKGLLRKYANHPDVRNIDTIEPDKYVALVNTFLLDVNNNGDLPDVTTGTQFANLRRGGKKDGAVPRLGFNPLADRRWVFLDDYDPDYPCGSFGGREALGKFLS